MLTNTPQCPGSPRPRSGNHPRPGSVMQKVRSPETRKQESLGCGGDVRPRRQLPPLVPTVQ